MENIGNLDGAEKDYDKALSINPSAVDIHKCKSIIYAKKKDFDLALQAIDQYIIHYPDDASGHFIRGRIHSDLGDDESAVNDYKNAVMIDQSVPLYLMEYVKSCLFAALYEEVINVCTKGLELFTESEFLATMYGLRGLSNFNLENDNAALLDLENAIKYGSTASSVYLSIANIYKYKGELDLALKHITKCISITPDFTEAYALRAALYSDMQKHQEAISDFNTYLEFTPESIPAHLGRSAAYTEIDNIGGAIQDLDAIIKLDDSYAPAHLLKSHLLLHENKPDEALKELLFATDNCSHDAESYEFMSSLYQELGMPAEAEEMLAKATLLKEES